MEEILREIFAQDRNILLRRDELIAVLEKKVPDGLRRDYAAIKKALELNIGEILIFSEDVDAAKVKAADALKNSGMQEARVNFVIETITNALDWNRKNITMADLALIFGKKELPQPVEITKEQIYKPSRIAVDEPVENKSGGKFKIVIGVAIILFVAYFFI